MAEHTDQPSSEQVSPLAPNSTLGIISNKVHYTYKGELYTTGGFTDYVEGLAAHFRQTILVVPVGTPDSIVNVGKISVANLRKISCKNYQIHPLWGYTLRTVIAWLASSYVRREARRAFADCDIVNVRMFAMVSLMALPVIEAMDKPIFFSLVRQPYVETVEKSRLRAMLVRQAEAALRRHLTFVHGWQLVEANNLNPDMCVPSYSSTYHITDIRKEPIQSPQENEPIRLIFVGALNKDKSVDVILRALVAEPQLSQKFRLNIVGDGPERLFLERLAEDLQLQSVVTFHGYVPHGEKMDRLMSSAHAMVFVPLNEGAPKVVTEALRFGLPVLASRAGNISTVIKEDINGWLVDAGHPQQVAEKLKIILKMNQATWETMSRANLSLARSYTIEKDARNTVQALIDRNLLFRS
jgi:glycosyltransferase involved in cell wall biosynthesis